MATAADARRMQAVIDRVRRYGVTVREMPGWQTRGRDFARTPVGIVDHHDASTRKSGEWGALGYILSGSPIAPLSQFQVARALDGVPKVAVVAAGICNHAGKGGPTRFGPTTVPVDAGNAWLYGAEKANDGLSEPYTAAAHYATDALFRAVLEVIS